MQMIQITFNKINKCMSKQFIAFTLIPKYYLICGYS